MLVHVCGRGCIVGYPGESDVNCKRRRYNQHGDDGSLIFPRTGVGWFWRRAGPRLQVCMVGISFSLQVRVMWSVHTHTFSGVPNNNNNNTIWGGSVFNRRGASTPLWGVEACSPPSRRPTQSQLSRPLSSGHHISMEHRLRRKQWNSDTHASNKNIIERNKRKRKKKLFSSENEKMKNLKKKQKMKKWTSNEKKWKIQKARKKTKKR